LWRNPAASIRRWLRVWRLPFLVLVAFLGVMSLLFGGAYWSRLWAFLGTPEWWAENTITLLVFTVLVGWIIDIGAHERDRMQRQPWEGWRLELRGLREDPIKRSLYWEDVQRFHASDFEYWKFVKSAVSSICQIKTLDAGQAEQRWLERDAQAQRIIIDFSRMQPGIDLDERNAERLQEHLQRPSTAEKEDGA